MYAKNLEILLASLCQKSDISNSRPRDLSDRFEALRGCALLPRGRQNRERPLDDNQITNAILGLAPILPGWAGFAAIALAKLRPVRGVNASFFGAETLCEAIERILSEVSAREAVKLLRISVSEGSTNSHGYATLSYVIDGENRRAFFVPGEAASLIRPETAVSKAAPGPRAEYDSERLHSPVSRDLVFSWQFFDRLYREVERTRAFPMPSVGDGSEYDAEEVEQRRRKKLGVRQNSRFLNIGVDNQVTWPSTETLVKFDRYHLVLMPKTKDNVQSIHIDLTTNGLSNFDAMTVINRFLSVMTWCDDQFAIQQDGWSGNPVPVPVRRRNLAFHTTHHWIFDRQIPAREEAQRALALYREARNAEQNFMVSYAVLNYYKIIEILYPDGPKARKWIEGNFPEIQTIDYMREDIGRFLKSCGSVPPQKYIYDACRLAVAHSSPRSPSDPDESEELGRLHEAAIVMRLLARRFIETEFGVSDCRFSGE